MDGVCSRILAALACLEAWETESRTALCPREALKGSAGAEQGKRVVRLQFFSLLFLFSSKIAGVGGHRLDRKYLCVTVRPHIAGNLFFGEVLLTPRFLHLPYWLK